LLRRLRSLWLVVVLAGVSCNSGSGGKPDGAGKDVPAVFDQAPPVDALADHPGAATEKGGPRTDGHAGLEKGLPKPDLGPDGLGPCKSKTCGANELCIVSATGQATCVCTPGFISSAQGCVLPAPGSPCDGQTCGGHGNCSVGFYVGAQCTCFPGYIVWGLTCIDQRKTGCLDAQGNYVSRGTSRCDATDTFLEVCHDGNGDGLNEWIYGAKCNETPCSQKCLSKGCADGQACPVGTVCVPEAHQMPLNVCVPTCDCSNCGNCSLADFAASGSMQAFCGSTSSPPAAACKLPCPSPGDGCIPYSPAICWPMEGCLSKAP
jgi:hypothetical protein